MLVAVLVLDTHALATKATPAVGAPPPSPSDRKRSSDPGAEIRKGGWGLVTGSPKPAQRKLATPRGGWEAAFWLLFQRTGNPIMLLDEHQHVVEVNDPGCTLLGVPRGELLGSSLVQRFPPEERAMALRDWQRLLRSGEHVGERVLVGPDGSRFKAEWAARATEIAARLVVIAVLLRGHPLPQPRQVETSRTPLTRREREIVTLIALGLETPEIAARLHLSVETVKSHVRNAMRKLRAHTRAQLVAVALTSGEIAEALDTEQLSTSPG